MTSTRPDPGGSAPRLTRTLARLVAGLVGLCLVAALVVPLLLVDRGDAPPAARVSTPTSSPSSTQMRPTDRSERVSVATPSPPASAPAPGFGMAMHFMWYDLARTSRELDQLRAAGLTVARFDVGWRWFEPDQKGVYDAQTLAKLDAILREMEVRGIAPIVTVIETPTWARRDGTDSFTPPVDPHDYADAVGMLAARYAGRPGLVWEIWNEPNRPEFWRPAPDPAGYVALLRHAYGAIKAADPDATVLGGVIAFNDLHFLGRMYEEGARGSFDGLALHPYAPGRAPDDRSNPSATFLAVEDMRAVMVANDDGGTPIWITEMGWGLNSSTDALRATYLTRAVEQARAWPYLRAFCVYTLGQDIGPDAATFGLLDAAGVPSRSWEAYVSAIRRR
jgi:polysaccharide biosynthesis protein PslG